MTNNAQNQMKSYSTRHISTQSSPPISEYQNTNSTCSHIAKQEIPNENKAI